jgi:hypothetical protein
LPRIDVEAPLALACAGYLKPAEVRKPNKWRQDFLGFANFGLVLFSSPAIRRNSIERDRGLKSTSNGLAPRRAGVTHSMANRIIPEGARFLSPVSAARKFDCVASGEFDVE